MMRQFGQEAPEAPRVLELNPQHDAVKALLALYEEDSKSEDVDELGRLFLDQAIIAEGSRIKDPTAFAQRMNRFIARV